MASPPGRVLLPHAVVDHYKRERTARALSELAHEAGLAGVTVESITKRAKIARNTFYELFANREGAADYAVELGNSKLREAIDLAAVQGASWQERIGSIVGAVLETAVAEPTLVELCLVHGRGAKNAAIPYDQGMVELLAGVLRAGRERAPLPSPRTEELLAFGLLGVVAERLRRGESDSLPELQGELTELLVRPFRAPSAGVASETAAS